MAEFAANDERNPLLQGYGDRRLSKLIQRDEEASSIIKSHVSVQEQKLSDSTIGERLPYNVRARRLGHTHTLFLLS